MVVRRTVMGRTVVVRRPPLHLRKIGRRPRAIGSRNNRHRLRPLDEVHGDDTDCGSGNGFLSQT